MAADATRAWMANGALPMLPAGSKETASEEARFTVADLVGLSLLSHVPRLAAVNMSVILELRDAYRPELARLQIAIGAATPSDVGQEAVDAFVSELWRTTVQPALLQLDDAVHDARFLSVLGRQLLRDVREQAALAAGVATALSALPTPARMAGASWAVGGPVWRALIESWQSMKSAQRSPFSFLYRVHQAAGPGK
jgi:hypothetical protein